jgi:hypothetical protein
MPLEGLAKTKSLAPPKMKTTNCGMKQGAWVVWDAADNHMGIQLMKLEESISSIFRVKKTRYVKKTMLNKPHVDKWDM